MIATEFEIGVEIIMKRLLSTALLLGAIATPAFADMKPGDTAPDFTARRRWAATSSTFRWPTR